MRLYIVSLAAGLLVGIIYALLQVRSPAPPAIALIGLLGMLAGEQSNERMLTGQRVTAAWLRHDCMARITGVPGGPDAGPDAGQGDSAGKETL
jgi:XapX domain-containing protein